MKISKLASGLFAALGGVLLAGTIIASFTAVKQPVKGVKPSQEANQFAITVLDALDRGDFKTVEAHLYGKPELGLDHQFSGAEGQLLWEAYCSSVSVETDERCFSEGSDIFQTADVTVMDIAGVCTQLGSRAAEILQKRMDALEEMPEDEAFVEQWKKEALSQALTDSIGRAGTKTYQITIRLVQEDGNWWALPDQAMLELLSGGLA